MLKTFKIFSIALLAGMLVYTPSDAKGGSSSSSSSSSSSAGRSSSPSSGGYSKPSSPSSSSSGYSKPSTPTPSATPAPSVATPSPSSGGYSKPAIAGAVGGAAVVGAGAGAIAATPSAPSTPHATTPSTTSSTPATPSTPSATTSSGGYSKPAAPTVSATPGSTAATTAQPVNKPPVTANDRAVNQSQSNRAFTAYKAPPAPPASVASAYAPNSRPTSSSNVQYSPNYGNWHPPVYVYNVPHYYGSNGVIDGMIWWMMLSSINNASHANAMYNMSGNQEYAAWRREADERARTDADLRAQIALLDAKLEAQKAAGQPIDPNYRLPSDIVVQNEAIVTAPVEEKKSSNTWIWIVLGLITVLGGGVAWIMLRKGN